MDYCSDSTESSVDPDQPVHGTLLICGKESTEQDRWAEYWNSWDEYSVNALYPPKSLGWVKCGKSEGKNSGLSCSFVA